MPRDEYEFPLMGTGSSLLQVSRDKSGSQQKPNTLRGENGVASEREISFVTSKELEKKKQK
jgi:hypothetical protein